MRKTAKILAGLLIVCVLPLRAWGRPGYRNLPVKPIAARGIPSDWTHRHVIFSRPSSLRRRRILTRNPRYRLQQAWRSRQAWGVSAEAWTAMLDARAVALVTPRGLAPLTATKPAGVGAWSEAADTVVNNPDGSSTYPAKYAFSGTSPSCNDWV